MTAPVGHPGAAERTDDGSGGVTVHDLYLDCTDVLLNVPCPGPAAAPLDLRDVAPVVIADAARDLVHDLPPYGA